MPDSTRRDINWKHDMIFKMIKYDMNENNVCGGQTRTWIDVVRKDKSYRTLKKMQ